MKLKLHVAMIVNMLNRHEFLSMQYAVLFSCYATWKCFTMSCSCNNLLMQASCWRINNLFYLTYTVLAGIKLTHSCRMEVKAAWVKAAWAIKQWICLTGMRSAAIASNPQTCTFIDSRTYLKIKFVKFHFTSTASSTTVHGQSFDALSRINRLSSAVILRWHNWTALCWNQRAVAVLAAGCSY